MTTSAIQNALLDPEQKKVLEAIAATATTDRTNIVTDLTALKTAINGINAKLDVLTAKLNADAGVTDTNYATNFASTLNVGTLATTA